MSNQRIIYMDNNATTQTHPQVLEKMLPYFSEYYGNASSMHSFGEHSHHAIVEARQQVAQLLGASPQEIFFTSGGTESDNLAIRGVLEAFPKKRHVITTRVEHPAVLNVCQWLEQVGHYDVTFLHADSNGNLDLEQYRQSLRDDTAIVSVMTANNETGVIFPVEEMAALAHARRVIFHTDAVQAAGKIPIDLQKSATDLLSISGHKLHGPKGIGALFVRRGTRIRPLVRGGHQERGRRPGTYNVPGIVGLGEAARLGIAHLEQEQCEVQLLRDRLEKGLWDSIPRVKVNGNRQSRLPNTLNISFEFVEGEAILLKINELGIAASSGSACTSGSLEPSHVLRAMGIPFTMVHGSVRFSLSVFNNDQEVDLILEHFPRIIHELRQISPYWSADFDNDIHYYPLP